MSVWIIAFGLVFVIEGLVFALAPSRIEDVLRIFSEMPTDIRRKLGLSAVAFGVVLVWIGKSLVG
ncbi:MAG: DUF2065 domain-containing protein [Dinoroseobacter sp.]|nr:DUF2065 domain-containing protein [Dinoroseobacter sp.]MDJ0992092.1 DUF2065 domain-containing protein [Dinoroseobacter sp.]